MSKSAYRRRMRLTGEADFPELASLLSDEDLVAFFTFQEAQGEPRRSVLGRSEYALVDQDSTPVGRTTGGKWGTYRADFGGDGYLGLSTNRNGELFMGGISNAVSIVAWVERDTSSTFDFVAGCWDESTNANLGLPEVTDGIRQYGLYLDATHTGVGSVGADVVAGYIAGDGGPTTGHTDNTDTAMSRGKITSAGGEMLVAMTYDGAEIKAFINARFEPNEDHTDLVTAAVYDLNPYAYAGGLNTRLSPRVSKFTVGGVEKNGTVITTSRIDGKISGIAVFAKAINQGVMMQMARAAVASGSEFWGNGFPNNLSAGSVGAVSDVGYHAYTSASGTDVSDLATFVGGASWLITTQTGPFTYITRSLAAPNEISAFTDSEQDFGIPLGTIGSITFEINNSLAADSFKLLLKIAGSWYATNENFSSSGDGGTATNWATTGETQTFAMTRSASAYLQVTLTPGSALSIGSAPASDFAYDALVQSYGFIDSAAPAGTLRIRDFKFLKA